MAREEAELLEMGARIRELRQQHGYKQQWIADQIGVRLRTYQFWQAGKSPPEQENLEKLAELFGVTPKYILRGETPELLEARGDQLNRIEETLAAVEQQLVQLVALLRGDLPAQGDLFEAVGQAVERALSRQAREAGKPARRLERATDRPDSHRRAAG